MPEFRKPRDLLAAMNRNISDFKDDVLAALGAEASQKLSEETGGQVKVTPRQDPEGVKIIYKGVGDATKSKSHANALKSVRDHISDNMEDILKRRKII